MPWVADYFSFLLSQKTSSEAPTEWRTELHFCLFIFSRVEGPHAESNKGPSADHDDIYGLKTKGPQKKLPSEEIKPTAIDTHQKFGKLLSATQTLDSMLNNYDHKLRPGIGSE